MFFPIFRNARLLLGALCFGLSLGAQAQAPTWQRVDHFRCSWPSNEVAIKHLASDAAGNYYVGGFTKSPSRYPTIVRVGTAGDSITFPYPNGRGAAWQIFVAKFNPAGRLVWSARSGSVAAAFTGMVLDPAGNVYVSGHFGGEITLGTHGLGNDFHAPWTEGFVAKIDANGRWGWAKKVGGVTNNTTLNPIDGLAVDGTTGRVAVLTYGRQVQFDSTQLAAPSNNSISFVALYGAGGQFLRAIPVGGVSGARAYGVTFDAAGDLLVTGSFNAPTIPFGTNTLTSSGGTDIFVAKCDTAGYWQWSNRAGGTQQDKGLALTCYYNGDVLLTGTIEGSTNLGQGGLHDAVLARINGTTGQWHNGQPTNSPNATPTALALTPDGRAHVAYSSPVPAWFTAQALPYQAGTDAFVGSINLSGSSSAPWALAIGGPNDEIVTALAPLSTGLLVAGTFTSPQLTIGSQTLTRVNSIDSFVGILNTPQGVSDAPAPAALTLAPNPAHGTVRLTGLPAAGAVQLLDALGRAVRTYPLAPHTADLDFNLTSLPPGLYTVRCGGAVRRLVVE